MYKQNTLFKLFSILVFGVFLNASTLLAQDKSGSYSHSVSKDGYEATVKLYVYTENGETYGRLRLEGNEQFGSPVEVNLWSLTNDQYTDFYYEAIAGDNPFDADAHLFTLNGTSKQMTVVFGAKLKAKVQHLPPATVFKYDGAKPSFEIKGKAQSQTVEVKGEKKTKVESTSTSTTATNTRTTTKPKQNTSQPTESKPKVETVKPITPSKPKEKAPSAAELLLFGDWKGNKATELTRYFDYTFNEDFTGSNSEDVFNWSLEEKGTSKTLHIHQTKSISKAEYNSIRAAADAMNFEADGTRIFQTGSKKQRIISNGNSYLLIQKTNKYTVNALTRTKLVISVKTSSGRVLNSYHSR